MKKRWFTTIQQKIAVASTTVAMYAVPLAVRAQLEGGTAPRKLDWDLENPIGSETIQELLLQLTDALVLIMSPVIVIMLIYSGFLFVQGANDEKTLEKAKTTLKWTIIGAAIILGAKGIAKAIQATIVQL